MLIISVILDIILGAMYICSGIWENPTGISWFDIGLGLAWSAMGGFDFYRWRKEKRGKR